MHPDNRAMDPAAPLTVLTISDVFFPRINGVSTSIDTFRADLPQFGVTPRLVVPDYPGAARGPDLWRVSARRLPFDPEDRLMQWRPLLRVARRAATGCRLVHIQTPFAAHYAGLRLARRLGLPVVATYHTHFEEYIQHYLPVLPRAMLKLIARRIARHQCDTLDAVIVPSPAMRDTLRDYGVRVPIHVLPTGIPVDHFTGGNRERFRARYEIPGGRPVALFVGRVAHEKNIGFLIEAMAHAVRLRPDLLLLVAGEGPALPALQRQVAALELTEHVRFIGYLDRERELPDCYAAADMFVFASKTETQGLVLLEAMAAGLPVYALACLGTRTIVEPGRGAVAAAEDPRAFGAGLADLVGDSRRLSFMAKEARTFAREWSAPERARQLAALYRSLVL